ncbi:MAG: sel1 repeat family protein [Porticoccaceae bacterium]|nr:sel1 repeat family protein [Porticoccaceae bacterium]
MHRKLVVNLVFVFYAFVALGAWAETKEPNYYLISVAASGGDAVAQYNMGVMHEVGQGVAKDAEKAVEWYRKSAEQGYENAQYNLGVMLLHGIGVEKNRDAAIDWFKKAAAQLNMPAIQALEQLEQPSQ